MKPKKSTFKVKAKKTERSSGGGAKHIHLPDGVQFFKLEDGAKKVKLDILPYIVKDKNHPDKDGDMAAKGELWYRRPYKLHQRIGADKKSYVCLQSFGKRCPICDYQKELFNTDKEAAVALYPKDRDLYAVKPEGSEDIHVWDMSQKLFHDVLVDELETDDENEDFADLESGKTLSIKFGWKTLGDVTFPEARSIVFAERDEAYDEDILDSVPCLDECLVAYSYEDLKNIFLEMGEEPTEEDDDDDEEEDEKPVRKPKSTKPDPKKSAPAKPAREDESELDWETLKAASFRRLGKLIKEVDLFIETDDYDEDDEDSVDMLRKDIAKELGIEIPKKSPRPEKGEEKTRSRSDNKAVRSPKVDDEDEEEKPKKSSPRSSTKASSAKSKKVEDDEDDDDDKSPFKDDDEDDAPKRPAKSAAKASAKEEKAGKAEKNRCPHGHKFGTDFEKTEDCDSCAVWDDCFENRKK